MKDLNKIFLVGRLGADPVSRATKNGTTVVNFPVATARKVKGEVSEDENAYTEETQWHRVVVWGKQGSHCAQYLVKGSTVLVEGSIRSRKFDGKDGSPRFAFEVHAENVAFLSRPRSARFPGEGEPAAVEAESA